jgi:hypothetical protein
VKDDGLSEEHSGFRLQSRRVRQARNQHETGQKVELFDPKLGFTFTALHGVTSSKYNSSRNPDLTALFPLVGMRNGKG